MALLGFLMTLLAPLAAAATRAEGSVLAHLAANAEALAWRVAPVAALAATFGVEYLTGSTLEHARAFALALASAVATLDVAGKLPAPSRPS